MSRDAPASLSAAERLRGESIERLIESGAEGLPALIEHLTESSWSLRRRVITALAGAGDAAVAQLCQALRVQRDSEARIAAAVDALAASTGASVDEAVLALAGEEDPAIVADAAQILGRRRSLAGIAALAALTRHRDDNVAVAAIEGLGRIGGRAASNP